MQDKELQLALFKEHLKALEQMYNEGLNGIEGDIVTDTGNGAEQEQELQRTVASNNPLPNEATIDAKNRTYTYDDLNKAYNYGKHVQAERMKARLKTGSTKNTTKTTTETSKENPTKWSNYKD